MRPLLNGEDVSEADLNDSANIVCLRQGADIHHSLLLIPLCAINGRSTMLCNEQLFFVWMFIFSSSVF